MAKRRTGYLVQRGEIYYCHWTIAGKKFKKSTGKTDRREAEAELARIMEPFLIEDEVKTLQNVKARIEGASAELATLDEQQHPPLTIKDAWNKFERSPERPDSGDSTLRQYQAECDRFERWIEKTHVTVKTLRDVTTEIAAEYAQDLNDNGLSASTYNQHVGFLRLLWRTLRKPAKIISNPWEEIRRKKSASVSRRELTVEELRRVCMSAKGELRLLFALGIYTGLRLGDCATLQWGEIDLARNVIRRVPMKVARRKPAPVLIPIHPALREMLAAIPEPRRRSMVLPQTAAQYARDSSALSKRIRQHFEDNEITTRAEGMKGRTMAAVEVGFHSLRHTFVSLCRGANAPLAVVEAIVGHSNPAMTRHYTHVSETAAGATVALLPSVMTDQPAPVLIAAPSAADISAKVREIAGRLNGRNWQTVKAEILALTAAV